MNIGKLRQRIQIQQNNAGSPDAYGEKTASWTTIATVWASVEPLAGREYLQALQVKASSMHRVRMRWSQVFTLTPRHRILLRSTRVLEINSVNNVDERNRELEVMCTEAAA
jgi:SPP1 family predicted phage head-tail adaptor